MLSTTTPQKAVELLNIEHEAVQALINELTNEEKTRPDTIRYGLYYDQKCSFKDLLAHLICYEAYTLEAMDAWKQGKKHWVSDAICDPAESRQIHYGGIADRADDSLEEVLDEWERTQSQLDGTIAQCTTGQWREKTPYPAPEPTDFGGMVERILGAPPRPLYRHLPVHIPDANQYIRSLRG